METAGTDGEDGRGRGPWWLKLRGVWGTGRRSLIQVHDVHVVDLGAPPEEGCRDPRSDAADVTAVLFEDLEPTSGLDVNFEWFTVAVGPDGQMEIRPHG